jgi:hypothetical protein
MSDESLTPEDYIALGLPAYDRDWSGEDMARAKKILGTVAQKGYQQLPRYKSTRSERVFSRLTSPANLVFYKSRDLPVSTRMVEANKYFEANNGILKVYFAGFLKDEVGDGEIIELLEMQLRTSVVLLELIDEFIPTLNKDDPSYQVRMQGLERVKKGLAGLIAANLQTLTERENYRKSELVRLVGYMKETFPVLVPQLPPGARLESLLRLDKIQDDSTMKDLQPGLGELRSSVDAALQTKRSP